jgi:pimeloyl-ACP methyl ester carboxylesterase
LAAALPRATVVAVSKRPVVATLLGAAIAFGVGAVLASPARASGTRWLRIHFSGPGGRRDSALVGLPAWYGPRDDPLLPLVVSPHSRGLTERQEARHWGDLPDRFRLIVVVPGLHGRVIPRRSWAWPPDIAEMTELPGIVHSRIPYLRFDPNRVYAAGDSMGGQETLMLVARRPDLFAAAVAADPVTNFLRRWYEFPSSAESWGEQAAATREVGATPRQARWLYVRRSPLFFARTFAFSGVPIQLWWNPSDTVVIREGSAQSGVFYRAVKRLNPRAPVFVRIDHAMHGWAFMYDHGLPEMVRFLLAHRRHGPPPGGFDYASWEPDATIWDWHIRSLGAGRGLWSITGVTAAGLRTDAAGVLLIRPPRTPSGALVDGGRARTGRFGVRVPPGRHLVAFVYRRPRAATITRWPTTRSSHSAYAT